MHFLILVEKKGNDFKNIEEAHKKDPEHCKDLDFYQASYEFVLKRIHQELVPEKYKNKFKLVDIINCDWGSRYNYIFDIDGVEAMIDIPVFAEVNEKNCYETLNGYELRFHSREYVVDLAFHYLDPRKFKANFEKWLDKKFKSKKITKKKVTK